MWIILCRREGSIEKVREDVDCRDATYLKKNSQLLTETNSAPEFLPLTFVAYTTGGVFRLFNLFFYVKVLNITGGVVGHTN